MKYILLAVLFIGCRERKITDDLPYKGFKWVAADTANLIFDTIPLKQKTLQSIDDSMITQPMGDAARLVRAIHIRTFGSVADQRLKFKTTRCIEWEETDSVAGYKRDVDFEFILTASENVIDTVKYNNHVFPMWMEKTYASPAYGKDTAWIFVFRPTHPDWRKDEPEKEKIDYLSDAIALWTVRGIVKHVSMYTHGWEIWNKHTVFIP